MRSFRRLNNLVWSCCILCPTRAESILGYLLCGCRLESSFSNNLCLPANTEYIKETLQTITLHVHLLASRSLPLPTYYYLPESRYMPSSAQYVISSGYVTRCAPSNCIMPETRRNARKHVVTSSYKMNALLSLVYSHQNLNLLLATT